MYSAEVITENFRFTNMDSIPFRRVSQFEKLSSLEFGLSWAWITWFCIGQAQQKTSWRHRYHYHHQASSMNLKSSMCCLLQF